MKKKPLPLYKRVANKIKEDIIYSGLSKDDLIPTEAKLAYKYQVSRVTIRRAIKLLEDENLLYSVQGSGTYIKNNKIEYDILSLQSFTAEMIEKNTNFFNEILDFHLIEPSKNIQDILGLNSGEKTFFVKRLRYINDEPSILEESHLPADLFPELSIDIMKNSLYEHINSKGLGINYVQAELKPIMSNKSLIHHLKLEHNVPILLMEVHSTFDDDTIFEYTKIHFNPFKYSFKFRSTSDI